MILDPTEFRNSLGNFATGVCVIGVHNQQGIATAMTVNSFSSVSLDPALVLWSLQNNSECYETFTNAETFSVNILSFAQKDISSRYAKKGDHKILDEDYSVGNDGTPIIMEALTSFECRLWEKYPGGDHVIIVGEVINMINHNDSAPLLFSQGSYRALAG